MSLAIDYANVFETQVRPRRRLGGKLRYAGVVAVWGGLFVIRPRLALQILAERRR
ncbi:hypothetical protein [Phenylobacterium sp.]|uniref:hypothetical protein n=1 Tax=Phenylobacterium sp. TaxID=1871053 RepID=UPI0039834253